MAVSNTIMILQQQYNQHNPIKTRLIVIGEEHHGENVWLPFWASLLPASQLPSSRLSLASWREEERGMSTESTVCGMSKL